MKCDVLVRPRRFKEKKLAKRLLSLVKCVQNVYVNDVNINLPKTESRIDVQVAAK